MKYKYPRFIHDHSVTDDRQRGYDDVNEDGSIDGLTAEFVDVDGISTRYYDEGSGDPLVLLHGGTWTGFASANTWSRNVSRLAERFRVIAPDRLGNGMTDNPSTEEAFVFDSEVTHMKAFLETLDIGSYHLCGQSRGGGLAAELAVDSPRAVETLTIVNSATLAPEASGYDLRRERLHAGKPDDPDSGTYFEDLFRHFEETLSYSTGHVTEEYVRAGAYMRRRPKAMATAAVLGSDPTEPYWRRETPETDRWHRSLHEAMWETDRRIALEGALTMPTLLYWGVGDPTMPLRSGTALYDKLATHNPDVRLYAASQAGHHPYREHPRDFENVVSNFVGTFGR